MRRSHIYYGTIENHGNSLSVTYYWIKANLDSSSANPPEEAGHIVTAPYLSFVNSKT